MKKKIIGAISVVGLLIIFAAIVPVKTETLPGSCFNSEIPKRLDWIKGESLEKARKTNQQTLPPDSTAGACDPTPKTVKLYIL